MVIQENPELTSSHRHTESIAIPGTIPSERNPETNYVTPIYQVHEKTHTLPILKPVGKAETYSCHKHHPQHSAIESGGNSQSQPLPEEQRVWTLHLVLQLLRDEHPKHLTLKTNEVYFKETHKSVAKNQTKK